MCECCSGEFEDLDALLRSLYEGAPQVHDEEEEGIMMQQQIELCVGGMTCEASAEQVALALGGIPGVKRVDVPAWQAAQVVVIADANVSLSVLTKAIHAAGYSASISGTTAMY